MTNQDFQKLTPRIIKGITFWPAIINGKQIWVTIPDRED